MIARPPGGKIRNSKLETRNKFKILNPNVQNVKYFRFEFLSFEFWIDCFGFRISDFEFPCPKDKLPPTLNSQTHTRSMKL